MADLDERVTRLEERSDGYTRTMGYLRAEISDVRHRMDTLGTDLRGGLSALGNELRGEMSALRNGLRGEMFALGNELRSEMSALRTELRGDMDRRFADVNRRFDRMDGRFNWLVGIVVTGFVTVIGTIAGAFWSLLQAVR
jgi:hypothetical protein